MVYMLADSRRFEEPTIPHVELDSLLPVQVSAFWVVFLGEKDCLGSFGRLGGFFVWGFRI